MTDTPERAPLATSPISAVLPLWNAETYVEQAVADWTASLDSLSRDYELLLVDDGSTDRTGDLAQALAESRPKVRLLRHPARQGIGAVVRTGLAAARFPLVATTDLADPYPAAALERMLAVDDQVDLIAGYRAWEPRGSAGLVFRWLVRTVLGVEAAPRDVPGRLARRLPARAFFAIRLRDVTCGLRLYRKALFDRFVIQSNGPFAQVEILAKANFLDCIMTEVPVTCRPRGPVGDDQPGWRQALAEGWQVFAHPQFRRAENAPPPASASEEQRPVSGDR
jgi:glycosyltransferase involved in cell wall biosynthesis